MWWTGHDGCWRRRDKGRSDRWGTASVRGPSPHDLCVERSNTMNRVTPRVLCVVVITLLAWPLAIHMTTAQQSTIQQSTIQSSQMQALVIGESVFTSSA